MVFRTNVVCFVSFGWTLGLLLVRSCHGGNVNASKRSLLHSMALMDPGCKDSEISGKLRLTCGPKVQSYQRDPRVH